MKAMLIFFITAIASLLVLSSQAVDTADQNRASAVDLTKPSRGLNDANALLHLQNVPTEESDVKNELQLLSPALVVGPETKGKDGEPPYRLARWRHEMLGQRVQVEGLALGRAPLNQAEMTCQRVVYEGGVMFVKGIDFSESDATGKAVRVSGTLCLEPESQMAFGGHDPIVVNKYYYIDADSLDVREQLTESRLVAPELKR